MNLKWKKERKHLLSMSLIPISSLKHLQRMCLSGKGITKTPTEKVFLHMKLPETPSMYVFQERSNKLLIRGYLKIWLGL